ncbi:DUF4554 domain-containing protein isoform X1 [Xyrichtys novacula]|uniref:DUF4554 domain-containing protein isoform X1 n=1 Tax=Xyrichtys novacula TaxID=13765 RepID=A0AAV1FAV7_XYRNO|nr:DUF4554 domain-containing protein isoform X1 [Xyrichtys novacula]
MLGEVKQVLRLVMSVSKHKQQHDVKTTGGLLVLLWADTREDSLQTWKCTVAAAGPWCAGIQIEDLEPDLKESMIHCDWSCPHPDPEELCVLTELYGTLRLLLSFQMTDTTLISSDWCARIETFLHLFSLTNARITIYLKIKLKHKSFQREFRGKIKRRVSWAGRPPAVLDITCVTQPPEWVKKGCWCLGGHPVCGGQIPLSIPPEAMNQGLFGELSFQPVTLLSPCVLQYPHLTTQLTHIRISFVDFGPSIFQNLPAHLDCQDLGLDSLHCSSFKELVHCGETVYTVKQENCKVEERESDLPAVQQSLLLLLFLQHSDPFTCQLSDIVANEALIEHHLEDILNNNRQAVTTALQTELRSALKAQKHRQRQQEKLRSASAVIASASISIMRCSSNMDFRNACLNCMKVSDTHDLSTLVCKTLRRVTSLKFVSRSGCYTDQMDEHLESDEPTRTEI